MRSTYGETARTPSSRQSCHISDEGSLEIASSYTGVNSVARNEALAIEEFPYPQVLTGESSVLTNGPGDAKFLSAFNEVLQQKTDWFSLVLTKLQSAQLSGAALAKGDPPDSFLSGALRWNGTGRTWSGSLSLTQERTNLESVDIDRKTGSNLIHKVLCSPDNLFACSIARGRENIMTVQFVKIETGSSPGRNQPRSHKLSFSLYPSVATG